MHVSALRQVLAVVATGSGLLLGSASLSHVVDRYPGLLYAAGEVRMLVGDKQGGMQLIGRAEAARQNTRHDSTVPTIGKDPGSKPIEICTKSKTTSFATKPTPREADSFASMAVIPPAPPSVPSFAVRPPKMVALAGFDSFGRRWHYAAVKQARVADALRAARRAERMRVLIEAEQKSHRKPVDVALIMNDLQRDLEQSGVVIPQEAEMQIDSLR